MDDCGAQGRASLLRKLIHLATAVVPAAGWLVSFQLALVLAGAMVLASLVLEVARRWWPWFNRLLWRLLPSVFRSWEHGKVLGSTWLAVGLLLTLVLCGRDAGGTAVLFLAWGDPAAEVTGRTWGRPGQRKSLAGSLGCLGACLLAAGVGMWLGELSPTAAVAGAAAATLVERWSPPPDDNVWMPLLSGLVILFMQRLAG